MKDKKKKEAGIFFTNPEEKEVSKEAKDTIKTFVEGEKEATGTHYYGEDFKRIIDVSYGKEVKKKKKKITREDLD